MNTIEYLTQSEVGEAINARRDAIADLMLELEFAIGTSHKLSNQHAEALREELANTNLDRTVSEHCYHALMRTFEAIRRIEKQLAYARDNVDLVNHYGKYAHDVLRVFIPRISGVSKVVVMPNREGYYCLPIENLLIQYEAGLIEPHIPIDYPTIRFNMRQIAVYEERYWIDYNQERDIVFVLDRKANQ